MKTHWLFAAVAGIFAAAAPLAGPGGGAAFAQSGHDLRSGRRVGDVDQVQILLEVGGDLLEEASDGGVQKNPMKVVGEFRYHEKTLQLPGEGDKPGRSVRSYETAVGVIKTEAVGLKVTLPAERRVLVVEAEPPDVTVFSPRGRLTGEQLDLVDFLGNTLLLDHLLPPKPVAVNGRWQLPESVVAGLLRMDALRTGSMGCTLTEVNDTLARFQISGSAQGLRAGASTHVDVKGKFRLDRTRRRIDWFALLMKENRDLGPVEAGIDAVVRLQVVIKPKVPFDGLADAELQGLPLESTPELRQLFYESADGDWQLVRDRRWQNVSKKGQERSVLPLRMIDQGQYLAHCNVSLLPKRPAAKPVELAEFQADVERALGDRFGEFIEAGQFHSDADYRVYRVVALGKVDDRPVRWTYYLITDRDGRQAALAFSVEGEHVERFGEADRELVNGFRFLPGKAPTQAAAKTEPEAKRQ